MEKRNKTGGIYINHGSDDFISDACVTITLFQYILLNMNNKPTIIIDWMNFNAKTILPKIQQTSRCNNTHNHTIYSLIPYKTSVT